MTEWINLCYFPFRFVIRLFCISVRSLLLFLIHFEYLVFQIYDSVSFFFFLLSTLSNLTLSLNFIILYFIFFHPHRIHNWINCYFFVYSGRTWNKTLWIIAKIKMLCRASSMSNNSKLTIFASYMPKWWCVFLLS